MIPYHWFWGPVFLYKIPEYKSFEKQGMGNCRVFFGVLEVLMEGSLSMILFATASGIQDRMRRSDSMAAQIQEVAFVLFLYLICVDAVPQILDAFFKDVLQNPG